MISKNKIKQDLHCAVLRSLSLPDGRRWARWTSEVPFILKNSLFCHLLLLQGSIRNTAHSRSTKQAHPLYRIPWILYNSRTARRSLNLISTVFLQLFLLSVMTSQAIWTSCFTGILNISSAIGAFTRHHRALISTRDNVFKQCET